MLGLFGLGKRQSSSKKQNAPKGCRISRVYVGHPNYETAIQNPPFGMKYAGNISKGGKEVPYFCPAGNDKPGETEEDMKLACKRKDPQNKNQWLYCIERLIDLYPFDATPPTVADLMPQRWRRLVAKDVSDMRNFRDKAMELTITFYLNHGEDFKGDNKSGKIERIINNATGGKIDKIKAVISKAIYQAYVAATSTFSNDKFKEQQLIIDNYEGTVRLREIFRIIIRLNKIKSAGDALWDIAFLKELSDYIDKKDLEAVEPQTTGFPTDTPAASRLSGVTSTSPLVPLLAVGAIVWLLSRGSR